MPGPPVLVLFFVAGLTLPCWSHAALAPADGKVIHWDESSVQLRVAKLDVGYSCALVWHYAHCFRKVCGCRLSFVCVADGPASGCHEFRHHTLVLLLLNRQCVVPFIHVTIARFILLPESGTTRATLDPGLTARTGVRAPAIRQSFHCQHPGLKSNQGTSTC